MDRENCQRKHPADTGDKTDDKFSIVCGDLGLGEGLKPGGMLQNFNLPELPDMSKSQTSGVGDSFLKMKRHSLCSNHEKDSPNSKHTPERRRSLVFKSKSVDFEDSPVMTTDSENFPTYADVPLGTSLRQQKKLFEQNLGSLRKKHEMSSTDEPVPNPSSKTSSGHNNRKRLTSVEIEKKLLEALQEVEELKIELDTCQKRLDAKYMAIAILKKQAEETSEEQSITEKIARECSKMLAEDSAVDLSGDLSAGGGDIDQVEGLPSLPPHELLWDDDALLRRVCQENALLMSTLEARSEELRRANCHKMALARERDELLALLDVREKLKYEKSRSTSEDDDYGTYTSAELAVLGACHCRGNKPEPCGCAHAAANLRRDIIRIKEEIELYKHRRDEAYLTVDAYRKAFEEQLSRNKFLTVKLSELTIPASSKTAKAKAAIKWLISVLNDDEELDVPIHIRKMDATSNGPLSTVNTTLMTPQELISLLTEMVHEKSEALSHQKLAAQILANKVEALEKQLRTLREGDVFT